MRSHRREDCQRLAQRVSESQIEVRSFFACLHDFLCVLCGQELLTAEGAEKAIENAEKSRHYFLFFLILADFFFVAAFPIFAFAATIS
jgi:hypothetical protein